MKRSDRDVHVLITGGDTARQLRARVASSILGIKSAQAHESCASMIRPEALV